MKSVPKIIIKARAPAASTSRIITPAPIPTPEIDSANEEEDDEDEQEGDETQPMDVDSPGQVADEEGGSLAGVVPRARGRPRGRGRGTGSGTSTPRARGRGRGRARGRGRGAGGSFTIRLPKRGEGEDTEAGVEAEGEGEPGEAEAGDEVEAEVEVKEKEAPLGGGKPFRKIQGAVHIIEGDEFITDDDPKGDEKIDKFGILLGGRRFKASTFTLPGRHPQRQYMLAIDAARTSGFRDSLYYFRRNLLAFKLNATQPEKDFLISEGKLGSHLRTRSVTLVTARSAFKLHGSKMIIDGRWVVDDYYEDKSLEEITAKGLKAGDLVGELPDPNAAHHSNELSALNAAANAGSNKNDRGGGAGLGIYRAGGPTTIFGASGWGPYSDGPLNAVRKSLLSRDGVTEENWMWMMASRVSEAGDEWGKLRKEALKVVEGIEGLVMGDVSVPSPPPAPPVYEEDEEEEEEVMGGEEGERKRPATLNPRPLKKRKVRLEKPVGLYEPHANIVHYRADTQPTRSRWEQLPDSDTKREVLGGTKAGNGAWALAWVDTVMELPKPDDPPSPGALAREETLKAVEQEEEPAVVE